MAEPSPSPIPTIPRPLVLADVAIQAGEQFVHTYDSAELARLAMAQTWTVSFAVVDQPSIITLPDQQVTEADLPMLTALFDELFESDPIPPYDPETLVAGAVQRLASVNAGNMPAEGE